MPYKSNFKEFQMKAKYLVLWGALAAFFIFSCKQEPTEVIIVKGERISAPKNLTVNFHDSPGTDYVSVSFTPSSSATSHKIYVSHFDNKTLIYSVTATGPTGGYNGDTLTYEIPKSQFRAGFYGGSIGGGIYSYWYLQDTVYIGVTSTSYAGIPSDMAWSKNLHTSSGNNPGSNLPGGGEEYDAYGTWNFNLNGQNVTVYIPGNGTWSMTGGYTLNGRYEINALNTAILFTGGDVNIGTAVMQSNSVMTLYLNGQGTLPNGTFYGTRAGY